MDTKLVLLLNNIDRLTDNNKKINYLIGKKKKQVGENLKMPSVYHHQMCQD